METTASVTVKVNVSRWPGNEATDWLDSYELVLNIEDTLQDEFNIRKYGDYGIRIDSVTLVSE